MKQQPKSQSPYSLIFKTISLGLFVTLFGCSDGTTDFSTNGTSQNLRSSVDKDDPQIVDSNQNDAVGEQMMSDDDSAGDELENEYDTAAEGMSYDNESPVELKVEPIELKSVKDCSTASELGSLETASLSLQYPSNHGMHDQCDWKVPQNNGKIAGVKEWTMALSTPDDHVVCNMNLKSNGSIVYDDVLMLFLNDKALFWGGVAINNLEKTNGMYKYDFDRLYDNSNNRQNGCVDGATQCEIPETQQQGDFLISFDKATNEKIAQEIESVGNNFTLRTFGDNDPSVDCTQSGLELTVEYQYFVKDSL